MMRKTPYLPGHYYVTMRDQEMMRNSLLQRWKPEDVLSAKKQTIESVMEDIEVIMNEIIRGELEMLWNNRKDTAFWPLFRGGRFKFNKEAIR